MCSPRILSVIVVSTVVFQLGCSSDGASSTDNADLTNPSSLIQVAIAPAGEITHYGAITLADDAGNASDIVGSFYRLDSGVSAEFAATMLSGQSAMCQVQDDGVIDFEQISAAYIPTMPGIGKTAVSAGESIILSSPSGTFATLDEQPAAGFLFYDLPNQTMLMDGPFPDSMLVDIMGSADIPAFDAVPVPLVSTLTGVNVGAQETISATTQFTWEPSEDPGAMIRIFSSTAGGFFLEDGITVICVVPDTGSFQFPTEIQSQLGSGFSGGPPLISRIVVKQVQVNTSVLYVTRESFSR